MPITACCVAENKLISKITACPKLTKMIQYCLPKRIKRRNKSKYWLKKEISENKCFHDGPNKINVGTTTIFLLKKQHFDTSVENNYSTLSNNNNYMENGVTNWKKTHCKMTLLKKVNPMNC